MPFRLKSGFFVRALIRRAEAAGAFGYVEQKGSEEAGAVYLKIDRLDGRYTILSQARDGEGQAVWLRPLGEFCDTERAAAYFDKQKKFDPDLWIVAIEDRDGRSFVDEKVI